LLQNNYNYKVFSKRSETNSRKGSAVPAIVVDVYFLTDESYAINLWTGNMANVLADSFIDIMSLKSDGNNINIAYGNWQWQYKDVKYSLGHRLEQHNFTIDTNLNDKIINRAVFRQIGSKENYYSLFDDAFSAIKAHLSEYKRVRRHAAIDTLHRVEPLRTGSGVSGRMPIDLFSHHTGIGRNILEMANLRAGRAKK
jgi:hypothetical protein